MTEKSKRRGILTLTKEGEQEKPRQTKRPATSRRVNIERDRSKKPGPKPASETAGKTPQCGAPQPGAPEGGKRRGAERRSPERERRSAERRGAGGRPSGHSEA